MNVVAICVDCSLVHSLGFKTSVNFNSTRNEAKSMGRGGFSLNY